MKNINKIKRLIKNQCACHIAELCSIPHYCCYRDGVCIYFGELEELPRCKYFEEGVLPVDSDLEYEYRDERRMDMLQAKKAKPKVKCELCGNIFEANSNRQKCCEKCSRIRNREQTRVRVKKARNKEYDVTL